MSAVESLSPVHFRVFDSNGRTINRRATVDELRTGGSLPFHAIISRGMLNNLRSMAAAEGFRVCDILRWWHCCAPLLEDAWNRLGDSDALGAIDSGLPELPINIANQIMVAGQRLAAYLDARRNPPDVFEPYRSVPLSIAVAVARAGLNAATLSYHQGIVAALDFLTADGGAALRHCVAMASCAAWFPRSVDLIHYREGHTSSVIVVEVSSDKSQKAQVAFVLNVVRDLSDAASELAATQSDLMRWYALDTQRAPAVYLCGSGRYHWFGKERRAPIVAVQHLKGASELHLIRDPGTRDLGRLIRVDRFRHTVSPLPDMIGQLMEVGASDDLWSDIVAWRTRSAELDWSTGLAVAPEIELNDGDVVSVKIDNKPGVAFVGSSLGRWRGPLGAWPYEIACSSARDDAAPEEQRIPWGRPWLALKGLRLGLEQACANRGESERRFRSMLENAMTLGLSELDQSPNLALLRENGPCSISRVRHAIADLLTHVDEAENPASPVQTLVNSIP